MNKKMIKIAAIVIVGIAIVGYGVHKLNVFGTTEVKVISVQKGYLSDTTVYTGMVTPGEVKPIYVDSAAIVENIYIRVGEEISKGTELMSFSNQSIVENENALKINELDIKNIELQIKDQESGSMKLELDNRQLEIKNLEEQIKADQRKLPVLIEENRIAKKKADTYMKLLSNDGVSATEASAMNTASNRAEAELEDLKTSLTLNKEKYQLMVSGYESLKRELNISRAQLDSQLEKLKLTNETLKLRDKQLREPFISQVEGIVTGIDVKVGGTVAPGQRIISVAVPGESRVVLELPTYQVGSIKKGDSAYVISREGTEEKRYKGIVEKASSTAVSSNYGSNKVISVEILVTEKNDLRPGFVADVELSGEAKTDVPLINSFSVIEENGEHYVYINENGKAKKQKIKVGARTANSYEVLDLPVGTEVIVNPFKVRNEEKVRIVD